MAVEALSENFAQLMLLHQDLLQSYQVLVDRLLMEREPQPVPEMPTRLVWINPKTQH